MRMLGVKEGGREGGREGGKEGDGDRHNQFTTARLL